MAKRNGRRGLTTVTTPMSKINAPSTHVVKSPQFQFLKATGSVYNGELQCGGESAHNTDVAKVASQHDSLNVQPDLEIQFGR